MEFKQTLSEKKIKSIFERALFKTVIKIHSLAIQHAPSGVTDELRQKIDFFPKQIGYSDYKIVSQAGHSAAIEWGTKPHRVSPAHLKDWARIKLGDENAAFAVAKKIQKVGTDAHPFMYPAFLEAKVIWAKKYVEEELKG